uniref:Serpentine receptor class gamma n=1 Tax=Strongyloides papillosus TaxID=174720 RepID=A0A0N5BDT1_STREA
MSIPIYDGIFLIIQFFCYVLYILLVICFSVKIHKDKKISCDTTSFVYHFIANSFFDFLQVFDVIVFQKFLHWDILIPFYLSDPWFITLYLPVAYVSISGSVLGLLINVVNRYCALSHISFFKNFWTKSTSLKLIFLQFLLPILAFSYSYPHKAYVVYVPSFNFYVLSLKNNLVALMNNALLMGISMVAAIITTILNIIILRNYKKLVVKKSRKESSKLFSMLFYMIITTLCLFALAFEQLIRLCFVIVGYKEGVYHLTYALFWILPILTMVQPIITLIMSKSLREYFLLFYFKRFLPRKRQIDQTGMARINDTKNQTQIRTLKKITI